FCLVRLPPRVPLFPSTTLFRSLLGFRHAVEVGLKVFLRQPRGAVNAAEHGVAVIAAPVSARHLGELERLRVQPAGGGQVRAAAQDRKSTRLNSSHVKISYAVFC